MKCQMESFAISSEPFGNAVSYTTCRTHNWALGSIPVGPDTQCPIGQIEDACDAAIARIDAAVQRLK
jgi:hypothetical protein